MSDNYRLCCNINCTNDAIFNKFKTNLEDSKELMESDKNIKFYLNIYHNDGSCDVVNLNKIATIELCDDGIIVYSLKSLSVSIIPYTSIKLLELIEKEN